MRWRDPTFTKIDEYDNLELKEKKGKKKYFIWTLVALLFILWVSNSS